MKTIEDGKQKIFVKSSENMTEISDEVIDVIITSPPYNVGKDYSNDRSRYNDKKRYSDYLSLLLKVFRECYRVLADDGIFFLNIGDSARDQGKSEDVVRCAVEAGFKRLQTVIWAKSLFGKGHYTPSGGDRRLNNMWEFIFVLYKSKKYQIAPKKIGIPYSDKSNIGRYSEEDRRDAGDIWFIPYLKTTGATIKKGHEAPFPIELPLKCLKLVPGAKTVLDPFAGTGSTLRAAKELDLVGYGYELYPREDIIRERLEETLNPLKTPLLPQLEIYSEFLTKLQEKTLKKLNQDQIDDFLKSLKKREKKLFYWACQDLEKKPDIYEFVEISLGENKPSKSTKPKQKTELSDFLKE
ncbi:MAG: DNA-methyltransferase [Candidatus Heimdallarchaeota archaeon]